jgi:hypothetical protein
MRSRRLRPPAAAHGSPKTKDPRRPEPAAWAGYPLTTARNLVVPRAAFAVLTVARKPGQAGPGVEYDQDMNGFQGVIGEFAGRMFPGRRSRPDAWSPVPGPSAAGGQASPERLSR